MKAGGVVDDHSSRFLIRRLHSCDPPCRHLLHWRSDAGRMHQVQFAAACDIVLCGVHIPCRASTTDESSAGALHELMSPGEHVALFACNPICYFHGLLLDEIFEKSR
ncbi:MAG: hypothetical protein QG581_11 [Patescibacteria group bacterium]|jgi:hypothetical protein|nr:hypothetical protein [Patescibacteria group bacterium]